MRSSSCRPSWWADSCAAVSGSEPTSFRRGCASLVRRPCARGYAERRAVSNARARLVGRSPPQCRGHPCPPAVSPWGPAAVSGRVVDESPFRVTVPLGGRPGGRPPSPTHVMHLMQMSTPQRSPRTHSVSLRVPSARMHDESSGRPTRFPCIRMLGTRHELGGLISRWGVHANDGRCTSIWASPCVGNSCR